MSDLTPIDQFLIEIHNFPGFYQSSLDMAIDDAIASAFDVDEACDAPEDFHWDFQLTEPMATAISAIYVDALKDHLKTSCNLDLPSMMLESVTLSKDYASQRDRLFVTVNAQDYTRIMDAVAENASVFDEVVREMNSPRPGFAPHYSNDVADWYGKGGNNFDHNEAGVALFAAAGGRWDAGALIDETISEAISDAVHKHMTPSARAIVNRGATDHVHYSPNP